MPRSLPAATAASILAFSPETMIWPGACAEAFHHDIDAMIADVRRREAVSRSQGIKFVTPRKRKKTPSK